MTTSPPAVASLSQRINLLLRRVPSWPLYPLGLLPGALLFYRAVTGGLGPDPVKPLEHGLGLYALQFLIAALCVTPLLRLSRVSLLRYRRAFGLLGFGYALLHLMAWLLLDIQLRWMEILKDLTSRPYIIFGTLALCLLLPLAWTSRASSLRRMGAQAWRRLHLLAYPATLLAALHFALVQKTWQLEPLLYLGATLALLSARLTRGPL